MMVVCGMNSDSTEPEATMEQLPDYSDDRLIVGCVLCGGPTESRDHVPSRVLLDEPYPENLPVVPACEVCNRGASLDEEYFACLLECVLAGAATPEAVRREKVRRILERKPALAAMLAQARTVSEQGTIFKIDQERINRVVLKLARGHAAYELSEPQHGDPASVAAVPLSLLSERARAEFEAGPRSGELVPWPEVGSRAMQRLAVSVTAGFDFDGGWVEVQPERYRYLAFADGSVTIRMVISEYLACEVIWN
jgi:hypothetical protein